MTGPEEFLGERAISRVRAAVRRHDAEAELSETMAAQPDDGRARRPRRRPRCSPAPAASSYAASRTCPRSRCPGLLDYAASPAEDVALVLAHSGGPKGSGVLTKLRKAASVTEVKSAPLTAREFPGFVAQELKAHHVQHRPGGGRLPRPGRGSGPPRALRGRQPARQRLRGQAADASRWSSSTSAGGPRPSRSWWPTTPSTARPRKALEELRWALDRGTAPVLVTSAMATGLRGLARFMTAPRGLRNNDLVREVGVPPWKIDVLRRQSHGWDVDGRRPGDPRRWPAPTPTSRGRRATPSYALEKMVLDVVRARPAR